MTQQAFAALLDRARAMDHAALSELYVAYMPVVYRYMLARVSNAPHAEDLTAETFFAMVDSIDRLQAVDEPGFAAWLLGIAHHKVALHYRRLAARPIEHPIEQEELPAREHPATHADEGDPLEVVVARERWASVVAALGQLTEEQRTVVLYRCVLGYETSEVASMMGRRAGAVRALQFRALATLADVLSTHLSNPALSAIATRSRRSPRERPRRLPPQTGGEINHGT